MVFRILIPRVDILISIVARVAPAAPNVPSQASASTKTADYRRSVIGGSGMDNAHNRTLEPHSVETRRQSDGQKESILSKVGCN